MKLDEKAIHDLATLYTKLQAEKCVNDESEFFYNHTGLLDNMTASYAYAVNYLSSLSEEFINTLSGIQE